MGRFVRTLANFGSSAHISNSEQLITILIVGKKYSRSPLNSILRNSWLQLAMSKDCENCLLLVPRFETCVTFTLNFISSAQITQFLPQLIFPRLPSFATMSLVSLRKVRQLLRSVINILIIYGDVADSISDRNK